MANVTFRGDAPTVAQVDTITIGTYDASTTYKVTINGKTISTPGTGGTNITTAAALAALLQACTYPEFVEITWGYVAAGVAITATAQTPGLPFILSVTPTGGTGGITKASTTPNSGPSDLAVVSNYSTGALPANGDTLIFENLANGLLYNADALAGVTTIANTIFKNVKGKIGLPNWNANGYWEYRQTYLQLKSTLVTVDCPECTLARIDLQTTACTITVTNTGPSDIPPLETLLIKGVHASNILNTTGGSVAVAGQYSEVSTFATINQGYNTQPQSDSYVRLGHGCTIANVNRIGGVMVGECAISGTLTMREGAGDITIYGGAWPTIDHFAGGAKVYYLSSGTITTLTIGQGTEFNSERNQLGFTLTNVVQAFLGASFKDKNRKATWAGIKPNGCGIGEVATGVFVDRGESRTWLDS